MRLAIVSARFNEKITDPMTTLAETTVAKLGYDLVATIRVPGAFDTPLAVQRMLRRPDVDGVVVLGAVITGDTDHDQVLMGSTLKTLQELALAFDKPVALGITGPGMTWEQAEERVSYAEAAVRACDEMLRTLGPRTGP